jgi:hypothetical protein
MVPNAIRHESVLDVEPITGMAMNMKKRTQVNMDYSLWGRSVWYDRVWTNGGGGAALPTTISSSSSSSSLPSSMWLPLYWYEEGGAVSSDQAASFKDAFYAPLWYKKKVPVVAMLVGACAVAAAVASVLFKLRTRILNAVLVAPVATSIERLTADDERFNRALKPGSAFRRNSVSVAPTGMGPQAAAQAAAAQAAAAQAAQGQASKPGKSKKSNNKQTSSQKQTPSATKAGMSLAGVVPGGAPVPSKSSSRMPATNPFSNPASKDKPAKKVARGGGQKVSRGGGQK